jgi:hypothetical protein
MALHVSIDGGYRQIAGLHNGQIRFLFCASQWWPNTINSLLIHVSIQKHRILLNLGEGEDAVAKDDNDDWYKKPIPVCSPLPPPAIIHPLKNEIGMDVVIRIIDIILCRTRAAMGEDRAGGFRRYRIGSVCVRERKETTTPPNRMQNM